MNRKVKLFSVLVVALALVFGLVACGGGNQPASQETNQAGTEPAAQAGDLQTITVAASVTPHAEILAQCVDDLAAKGYKLEIKEFDDYVIPNNVTEDGEVDANYFQHITYLNDFNANNNTHLVSAASIHYEPFGLYAGRLDSLDKITDGCSIAIPNDGTNEGRALFLLQDLGLIKLRPDAGFTATKLDIEENPHNLDIQELEAAQIPRSLVDVDFAIINGNYAIQAGLNVSKDALAKEEASSKASEAYANILAVKEGNENNEAIKALIEELKSEKIKKFVEEKYQGSVVLLD